MNVKHLLTGVAVVAGLSACENKSEKPNIIYILADDLGYGDLGCYGQKTIETPNIDAMAANGMLFTNHYAGNTVCAPSRCALMTGLHMGHAKIRANANVALDSNDLTVAELLKDEGYKTCLVGKWGLGEAGSAGTPDKKGFDNFLGYLNQIKAHNSFPEFLWRNTKKVFLDNKIETIDEGYAKGVGGVAVEKRTHSHDMFVREAMNFIEENKDNPFFVYMAITIPHANNEAWHWNMNGMEAPDTNLYSDRDWPAAQRAHAGMITYMDKDVGRILTQLKDLGIDKNTLVIFTSDNGPHREGGAKPEFFDSNGPLKGIKRDLYEGGIRVPMIAYWPGKIEAGSKSNHISAFWDFLPTACDIAGADIPENTDGISFLPTLLGEEQSNHDYLYWEFPAIDGRQAIRKGEWKAVKYKMDSNFLAPIELYNLTSDIGEENNVADNHPEILKEMEKLFSDARTESEYFKFKFEK